MQRPNIVYLHSHDTGRYIQPYGHAIATPNMQRLAEQGVLFRQAFCAAPTCSPSRAALLSGRSPHSIGMLGLAHGGWSMADYSRHLVNILRQQAGYHSVLAGVQHVAKDAQVIGYDELPNPQRAQDPCIVARQFLDSAPTQPFFLDVGFSLTHRTKTGGKSYHNGPMSPTGDPRYVRPPAPLPDTPSTREDVADFMVAAQRLDQAYGVVLAALEQNGLADNTLVICTTDHGIAFPGMKCNLTDHGMGVLLIMRGPGGFAGGKVIDAMVSHLDVLPTLCELLNIEGPSGLEGNSMMPLIRGERDEVNEEIFGEVTYHSSYEPMRAVRTQRWKYIKRFDQRRVPTLPHCDASVSKTQWIERGWQERPVAAEALYDLMFDPNEANNLAGDSAHADIAAEMGERLERWMHRTGDPLLKGPVPLVPGGRCRDPDEGA